MLNEPPPEKQRRVHPLERRTEPPPPQSDDNDQPKKQVMLHIPFVKPYVTYVLMAINIAVFGVGLLFPEINQSLLINGANNSVMVLEGGEYYRLLTAMFLHGGIAHILFNMYALWIIGTTVEGLFGHVRFVIIYFLGGLGGSVLSVMFNGPIVISVGASGAVFAVFGAEIIYLYQHRKLLGEAGQRRLRSLVVIAGINFFIGLASAIDPGGPVNIDNWGHVGGFVGGIILTWYIGPLLILQRHPEREGAFIAEDVNPLVPKRYQIVILYVSALLVLLIVARLLQG